MKKIFLICLVFVLLVCACSNDNSKDGMINSLEAKELMINKQAILVDVRSEEEYSENHIDGAISFPVDTIAEDTAKSLIGNTDKVVIVYCKSGARSSEALIKLNDLGYNDVYNLGSIDNWKE